MGSSRIVVVRNEVDPEYAYHCDALARHFPDAPQVDYPAGDRPDLSRADGVVLSGSTAGVYERDRHSWIADQLGLVREVVDRGIPTLGVCFGHQVVNEALGGTVEAVGTTARLVAVEFAAEPIFDGVAPVVATLHGDHVTAVGDGLAVIATADYYPAFGTAHETAPVWTVQFHPELTAEYRDRIASDFGWESTDLDYGAVTTTRLLENFQSFVGERAHAGNS